MREPVHSLASYLQEITPSGGELDVDTLGVHLFEELSCFGMLASEREEESSETDRFIVCHATQS